MSDKFKGKYRSESARLQNWDYGSNAAYFITICTQNREQYFGNVIGGKMILNDIGQIANECWLAVPEQFPFVKLGGILLCPIMFTVL